jgi:hypothetical protein
VRDDQAIDVPVQLRFVAFRTRLELRAQIGAFASPEGDKPTAERTLLALITQKTRTEITISKGIRQTGGVKCRLGYPGADVRPGDEGRIAQQGDTPEHHRRGLEIEDRLKERRGTREDFGDLRGYQGARGRLDVGQDAGADQGRRN